MKLVSISGLCICISLVLMTYAGSSKKKTELEALQLPHQQIFSKTTQLRIFTINKGKMDAFLNAWLKGVYPLRIEHGFKIEGAWTMRNKNKFIWLLSYDGPIEFEAKDSAYYASTSRKSMDPDPAQYITDAEYYFIDSAIKP